MIEGGDSGQFISIEVTRVESGKSSKEERPVAVEVSYTILANGVEIGTLLCSPSCLNELAAGFLFSSGHIESADDIISSTVDSAKGLILCEIAEKPGNGRCGGGMNSQGRLKNGGIREEPGRVNVKDNKKIGASQISEIAEWLQNCSELFRRTGGFHTAGLSIGGAIPGWHMDDISRHNSVDKVIGRALIEGADFSDSILVSSARISSEMLNRAFRARIPVVISRGAPTLRAVLNAKYMGITVVGFARGGDFTIYANEKRVSLQF